MSQRVFIETYGCQMNEADTELMHGLLRHKGYSVAESADAADVVLLNTCAVRERAEERIFGRLGWLKTLKANKPGLLLGVTGCMAERMRGDLLKRAPFVDLVIGPDAYRRLPELLTQAREEPADALIDVRLDKEETYADAVVDRVPGVSGWVTIQRGCDKFCTFCIVPFVRGRERSLAPETVVAQATEMAQAGFKEVTLLGQTVSSYYERGVDFADLLSMVHEVEGISRIRFTSPYPNDFSDRLVDRLASLPRMGKHLHLPVQSGSDTMLRDMKRGYTVAGYMRLIDRVRRVLPDWSITTDIIVGYPGETEEDFQATLDLMETVQFDAAFMFHYSERDGTFAARKRPDNIPLALKKSRLQRLINMQEAICKVRNNDKVGTVVEVLVKGPGRRNPEQMIGRSSCFRTTILPQGNYGAGDTISVRIVGSTSHTLFGEPVEGVGSTASAASSSATLSA